ncbi:hypothetical protein FOZ61_003966 [Perkinsus olseni]|uniref:Uncharacterized protein n=1 Tax=Perkinsus olseni TaxID=32597 RepID=A0A7J6LMI3_PEROL|nr:hypothetical protein FOZ61_003966 [Perkinsus olseni]KAF4673649.1 hypothetical protein FOL46_006762 [Perkinsus olseni]
MIGVIIAVIYSMVLVHAKPLWVNDTAVSPGQRPPLRSLRLPVVHEQPPKCLPPDDNFGGKNYCWFILEDSPQTQVQSGMLIRSNTSHTGWYSTLKLIVLAPPHSLPTDVGLWAEGHTFLKLDLPSGITVDLEFYVPLIWKVGGKVVGDRKEIEFKTQLYTTVNIPYMGTVRTKGEGSGAASVDTKGGKNQILSSVTAIGEVGDLFSEIVFYADVWALDLAHWNYDCYIELYISGKKDGLKIEYDNSLPVFSQKSPIN